LYTLALTLPIASQFFFPATPIFSWLLFFFSSRFIPKDVRPQCVYPSLLLICTRPPFLTESYPASKHLGVSATGTRIDPIRSQHLRYPDEIHEPDPGRTGLVTLRRCAFHRAFCRRIPSLGLGTVSRTRSSRYFNIKNVLNVVWSDPGR
jgi:hypothetical protein